MPFLTNLYNQYKSFLNETQPSTTTIEDIETEAELDNIVETLVEKLKRYIEKYGLQHGTDLFDMLCAIWINEKLGIRALRVSYNRKTDQLLVLIKYYQLYQSREIDIHEIEKNKAIEIMQKILRNERFSD